jgi:hypothetical protein
MAKNAPLAEYWPILLLIGKFVALVAPLLGIAFAEATEGPSEAEEVS